MLGRKLCLYLSRGQTDWVDVLRELHSVAQCEDGHIKLGKPQLCLVTRVNLLLDDLQGE